MSLVHVLLDPMTAVLHSPHFNYFIGPILSALPDDAQHWPPPRPQRPSMRLQGPSPEAPGGGKHRRRPGPRASAALPGQPPQQAAARGRHRAGLRGRSSPRHPPHANPGRRGHTNPARRGEGTRSPERQDYQPAVRPSLTPAPPLRARPPGPLRCPPPVPPPPP